MSEGEETVEDLERQTISEAMRLLGQRKSKRKTLACRRNAKKRWDDVARERGKSVKSSE